MLETEKIPKYTDASFFIEIDYFFIIQKKKGQKKKTPTKTKNNINSNNPVGTSLSDYSGPG